MLTIRDAQMAALDEAQVTRFKATMAALLKETWPQVHAALGDEAFRAAIGAGVDRAAAYGINGRHDVARYLNVQLALGPGFDTAEETAWAGEILRDPDALPSDKVSALAARTRRALEARAAG